MSVLRRSRVRADAVLVRLAARYGEFRVREDVWQTTQTAYDRLADRFEANANGGAGIWVRDATDAVLLVRHEGSETWAEPSGKRERGEPFPEAARREVNEETGIEATITGVLEVTLITHDAWNRPPLVSPIVLFTGEPVAGDVEPRDGEIAEARWWREPPEDVLYDAVRGYPFPEDRG